jgi:hypothetical protein
VGQPAPSSVSEEHRAACAGIAKPRFFKTFPWKPECFYKVVQRHFKLALVLTFCMSPLQSATLERLSLDDMIGNSTAIVRGKVVGSHAAQQGPVVYTHYAVQVTERFKGPDQTTVDIAVPGGTLNGLRQTFAGAPEFRTGDEFVLFLWTGRSGLTQILGLTQGIFSLSHGVSADAVATRAASKELMLDRATGKAVSDQTLVLPLSELRSRIAGTPNKAAAQ